MLELHEHLRKHLSLVLARSHRFTYVNHKRLACICIRIVKLEIDAETETRARSVDFAHVPQLFPWPLACPDVSRSPCHMPCTSVVIDGSFSQGVNLVAALR
jgi:hypothetical protein